MNGLINYIMNGMINFYFIFKTILYHAQVKLTIDQIIEETNLA